MKTPKWETGLKGAIWKDGKMMTADANVTPGMRVTAQCKGEIINLRISEEIESRVSKLLSWVITFLMSPMHSVMETKLLLVASLSYGYTGKTDITSKKQRTSRCFRTPLYPQ